MDKLSTTVDEELEIMKKWSLNAEEWLFLRLLFVAKYDERPVFLNTYFNECAKTGLPLDLIKSLQSKRILSKNFKAEKGVTFSLDDIEFEDNFEKQYFKVANEAGKELFEEYPEYLQINGKLVTIRNVTKQGFNTLEDFFFVYSKAIRHSRAKHEEILQSLKFAKDNNLINYLITEYVITRKWEGHIASMESGKISNFITTFDTMSLA